MAADTLTSNPLEEAAKLDAAVLFIHSLTDLALFVDKHQELGELAAACGRARDLVEAQGETDEREAERASEALLRRLGLFEIADRPGAEVGLLEEKLTKLARHVIGVEWDQMRREWER